MVFKINHRKYIRKPGEFPKSRLTKLKYKHVADVESVVVIGGGPSTALDKDVINEYIIKNNSIVIGTNYSYPFICKMDYTYFGDAGKFKSGLASVRGGIFVCVSLVDRYPPYFWLKVKNHYKCYEVFLRGLRHGNYIRKWSINSNGTFPAGKYGPSGLAVSCISLLFNPKEVVLTGIDGPIMSGYTILKKKTFDGRVKEYGPMKKYRLRRGALEFKVIKLLRNNGVKIRCAPSSPFWGINKKKHGINSI